MTTLTTLRLAPAVCLEPCAHYLELDHPGICTACGWTLDDHDHGADGGSTISAFAA